MSNLLARNISIVTATGNGIKRLRELLLQLSVTGVFDKDTSSWCYQKASEVCIKVQSGKTPKEGFIDSDGIPFLKVYNIVKQKLDFNYRPQFVPASLQEGQLSNSKVLPGDVLMNIVGPPLGKVAIVTNEYPEWNINQAITLFRPGKQLTTQWLYYYLCSGLTIKDINTRGTAGQDNISLTQCRNMLIRIPPIEVQNRIIARIEEFMILCDRLEAEQNEAASAHSILVKELLDTLCQSANPHEFALNWRQIKQHFDILFTTETSVEALKQSLRHLAVMGKLVKQDANDEPASELVKRFRLRKASHKRGTKNNKNDTTLSAISKDDMPFTLPSGWDCIRLGDMADLITKGSSPKWQGVNYTSNPDDVLFITSENVGQFKLLLNEPKYVEHKFNQIEPRSVLKKGDFLMNIVGASIGRTAIFDVSALANINQAVCLIRIDENACSDFLLHFFNSKICIDYMFDKQVDNARANLSMGNIAKFVIPLPPLQEQHRIVEKLNELLLLCDKLKSKLCSSTSLQNQVSNALVEDALSNTSESAHRSKTLQLT